MGSESSSPLDWPSTIGRRPSHLPIARSVISSCRHCRSTPLSDEVNSWFARALPSASATSLAAWARALRDVLHPAMGPQVVDLDADVAGRNPDDGGAQHKDRERDDADHIDGRASDYRRVRGEALDDVSDDGRDDQPRTTPSFYSGSGRSSSSWHSVQTHVRSSALVWLSRRSVQGMSARRPHLGHRSA